MSNSELLELAEKYNLLSEQELEHISVGVDEGWVNPHYERNLLGQKLRDKIVKDLVSRDKFVSTLLAEALSLIAIAISIISL